MNACAEWLLNTVIISDDMQAWKSPALFQGSS